MLGAVTSFLHPGRVTVFFDPNSPGRLRRYFRPLFLTNDSGVVTNPVDMGN